MLIWENTVPELKDKVDAIIAECASRGVKVVPYLAFRTLRQQNALYRQSRPRSTIEQKVAELKDLGAPYLADQLAACPALNASFATKAVGGLSWHNWGRAVDCYISVGGKPQWDGDHEGYKIYGDVAQQHGMKWGASFHSFKDPGHIQLDQKEVPDLYSYGEINEFFQSREWK